MLSGMLDVPDEVFEVVVIGAGHAGCEAASASARPEVNNGAGQTQMSTIALIDTRLKIPGESIGTVVSTHETILAALPRSKRTRRFKSGCGKAA